MTLFADQLINEPRVRSPQRKHIRSWLVTLLDKNVTEVSDFIYTNTLLVNFIINGTQETS